MTPKQRVELGVVLDTISIYTKRKEQLFAQCQHEEVVHTHYLDYDRNRYKVYCVDCGRVLMDGNRYEYRAFCVSRGVESKF